MVYRKQELLALILNMVLYYGVYCSESCSISLISFLVYVAYLKFTACKWHFRKSELIQHMTTMPTAEF